MGKVGDAGLSGSITEGIGGNASTDRDQGCGKAPDDECDPAIPDGCNSWQCLSHGRASCFRPPTIGRPPSISDVWGTPFNFHRRKVDTFRSGKGQAQFVAVKK